MFFFCLNNLIFKKGPELSQVRKLHFVNALRGPVEGTGLVTRPTLVRRCLFLREQVPWTSTCCPLRRRWDSIRPWRTCRRRWSTRRCGPASRTTGGSTRSVAPHNRSVGSRTVGENILNFLTTLLRSYLRAFVPPASNRG